MRGADGYGREWIADSSAELQAARRMTLHAAWRMDQEGARAARTDISQIKYVTVGPLEPKFYAQLLQRLGLDPPQPAPAPRFGRTPGAIAGPPPWPGQHNDELLAELGISTHT